MVLAEGGCEVVRASNLLGRAVEMQGERECVHLLVVERLKSVEHLDGKETLLGRILHMLMAVGIGRRRTRGTIGTRADLGEG